jgi:trans-aconitate methyltransferase
MERDQPIERMKYWDEIYTSRPSNELGWYQQTPETSLSLIDSLSLDGKTGIIDIGGGDSLLTEFLLERGFADLSLLDVSENAIKRSRQRLGDVAERIQWIISDIVDFKPGRRFDLWHDRACFHFLTSEEEVSTYARLAQGAVNPGGHMILGAFAQNGPEKCSGLPVQRYGREQIEQVFSEFELLRDLHLVHLTPSGGEQNYIFCLLKRKQ